MLDSNIFVLTFWNGQCDTINTVVVFYYKMLPQKYQVQTLIFNKTSPLILFSNTLIGYEKMSINEKLKVNICDYENVAERKWYNISRHSLTLPAYILLCARYFANIKEKSGLMPYRSKN